MFTKNLGILHRFGKYIGYVFLGTSLVLFLFALLNLFWTPFQKISSFNILISYSLAFLLAAFWVQIPRLNWQNVWYSTVLGAVSFPFFCFALGAIGFLFGISITRWHGVLAFLFTLVAMAYSAQTRRSFGVSVALFVLIWSFSLFLALIGWEHREDGMMYHKPASVMLARGWNPVWQENLQEFLEANHFDEAICRYSHAAYFPKGLWIVNAILHRMTGTCESGTSVYVAMILTAMILFYFMLQEWFLPQRWAALLASGSIALNSNIIQEEIFSGMIDGPLVLCLETFLFAGILWLKNGDRKWIPFLIGSAVFGCSMKHNAPVFFGLMGILYTLPYLYNWIRKQWGFLVPVSPTENKGFTIQAPFREWILVMLSIPALTAILCFNPFITNFVCHSSPFYPLHSLNPAKNPPEDILQMYYTRPDFYQASKSQRFIYTFLLNRIFFVSALSSEPPVYSPDAVHFLRFWFSPGANEPIGNFSLMVIFTVPLLFFVRRWDFWLVIFTILITTAVHPHSWWGRFVPQFWALPFLVLCFVNWEIQNRSKSKVRSWRSRRRWNWLFYGLLGWSFVINVYIFSFFCYTQVEDCANLVKIQEFVANSEDVALIGGITKTENAKMQLRSFPWYLIYLKDFLYEQGMVNVYPTFMNQEMPKDFEFFQIYRFIFVWPTEAETKNISWKVTPRDIPKSLVKQMRFRLKQFQAAWSSDEYPTAVSHPMEDFAWNRAKPEWLQKLLENDSEDVPRDYEEKIREVKE